MHKNVFLLGILSILVAGCNLMTTDQSNTAAREDLEELSIGMSKQKAMEWISAQSFRIFRIEILKDKDKTFEVVSYVPGIKDAEEIITKDDITPLIFEEDKLIGWGWSSMPPYSEKYQITQGDN
jgi:hypothetical protein